MTTFEWAGRLLRRGDSGSAVRHLQQALNALGLDTGGADGSFGARTEEAVKSLQNKAGLQADGVFGPASAGALEKLLAASITTVADKLPPELAAAAKQHSAQVAAAAQAVVSSKDSEAAKDALKGAAGKLFGKK